MPRGARLDAPDMLHHVIIRGIERKKIVTDDKDRKIFTTRMGNLATETETARRLGVTLRLLQMP